MKELMQLLNDAASGKNPAHALNIPTADVAAALANANIDFSFVKFWLAGYYQTLRSVKAQFGNLTAEAQRDFNNVKAFLKQFDGNIDKWAEIRPAEAEAAHITPEVNK